MYVWVEWTCRRCNENHVARFDIVIQHGRYGLPPNLKDADYYRQGEIKIDDVAFSKEKRPKRNASGGGSRVFCPYDTELTLVIVAVSSYMEKYYSVKQGTLIAEVCSG